MRNVANGVKKMAGRVALALALVGPAALADAQASHHNVRQRIGYETAQDRMGRDMPTGEGIVFAHVEGDPGKYGPKLEGRAFEGVAFSLRSGPSKASGHAAKTAQIIYGSTGLAPGVEVVHCMTTQSFLGPVVLNAGSNAPPPLDDQTPFPVRVYTHSWIGSPPERQAAAILRRVDFLIDTRDVVMCVGVNNGRHSAVPPILASAHNVIAVGTTNGASSGGYTSVEGEGRCKPDLVAPDGMTSFTTPVVSACAALLLQQGDRLVAQGHAGANRSEVIKAALMGGAAKSEAWSAQPGKPLDQHLGAGEVNLDRALRILSGAPLSEGQTIKRLFGWAYPTLPAKGSVAYTLKLPVDTGPVTLTAVWNRRIDGRIAVATVKKTDKKIAFWVDAPRLADIDLRLSSVDGQTLTLLAHSASENDNVELIYLPSLAKGEYRIELLRDPEKETLAEDWEVALAWVIDKPRPVEEKPPPKQLNREDVKGAEEAAPSPPFPRSSPSSRSSRLCVSIR